MKNFVLYALVAVIAAAAGVLVAGTGNKPASETAEPAKSGGLLDQLQPGYSLASTDGQIVSSEDFNGQVVLVNFWATWCAPCRKEMPMLVEIQQEYADRGLAIVGIALDEVQAARDFAAELGINYTLLVGTTDVMTVNRDYGNKTGSLPYSVLVDRDGVVRWQYLGELHRDELLEQIEPLL